MPIKTPAKLPVIAITAGEPAGIGPDLCVMLADSDLPAHLVFIADRGLLELRAEALGLPFRLDDDLSFRRRSVLHEPLAAASVTGKLDPINSSYVLRTLRRALHGCLTGAFDALVTAPVHKAVINDAGFPFTGHTEFLAAESGAKRVVMMLVGGGLRVALATTHLALKDVPAAITEDRLTGVLRIVEGDLRKRFAIAKPRIAVAGLNPHAGESGHLGREEIDIIEPAMENLRKEGMQLAGPLPADTLFTPKQLSDTDCVLAMYHDQGLPVLKHASFGHAVNITLGLPFIRTSVDHGTALDLAGTGNIDAGSMRAALELAIELVGRQSTEQLRNA